MIFVYVDTSYLTYMPSAEMADWNKLLKHAKSCITDLNTKPKIEIYISEIAIREYRGKMIDELYSKIEQTKNKMNELQNEWKKNSIAKELDYPLPRETDIFPNINELHLIADNYIQKFLTNGIKKINMSEHHNEAVWKNYFDWQPPFNNENPSERADKKIREKRRTHIPDAWILAAAIDASKIGKSMLCLCKDTNLTAALEIQEYRVFKTAQEILEILFKRKTDNSISIPCVKENIAIYNPSPLESLLSTAPNSNIRNIYLRLLGFAFVLNAPTHETLIESVLSNGFERKLTEACAVMLSDKSAPYIKNTGSHYIAGDIEVCSAAAKLITSEIINMLERV